MQSTTLLYDETCGFCTRIVQWVARQQRGDQISIMPCQFALITGKFPVSEQECLTSIQVFNRRGERSTKGQAVAEVLGILWNAKWPMRVARLPVIRQVLNLGYTFIAVNRHRLPGIKQMCAAGKDGSCHPSH